MRAIMFRKMDEDGKALIDVAGYTTPDNKQCASTYYEMKHIYGDEEYKIDVGMWSIELLNENDEILDCFPVPNSDGEMLLATFKQKHNLK